MDGQSASYWEGEVQRRRGVLLNRLLVATVIVGILGLPALYFFQPGQASALGWVTLIVFSISWLITLVALLWRGLKYHFRALSLILVAYILIIVVFLDNGLPDNVDAWMLIPIALAFVLLGPRFGILVGAGGSIVLFTVFSVIANQGWIAPTIVEDPVAPTRLILQGVGHLLAVVVLTLVLLSYNRGWSEALRGASAANRRLRETTDDLQVLTAELDRRVVERTQQLAEALAKNEAILESIADGVIVFDLEGRAVTANPAMGGLMGQPVEEIAGVGVEALMGDGVDPASRAQARELLSGIQTTQAGFKFRWGEKVLAVSLAPVRDISGDVTGTVAVFRDFTQEAEIDRMRSTFLAIASHDLRTPLTAILGFSEMLQEKIYGALSDEQGEVVRRIVSHANYMMSVASNLLGHAQIEAGTLKLEMGVFSPREMVERVVGGMEALASGKGLVLAGEVSEEVPRFLVGDAQKLSQILTNLVGNAIKFTEEGQVRVRVYLVEGGRWALEVLDTGRGIPEEARAYIFEPFKQAEEERWRGGGAGLGLAIVKRLVEMMEGEVRLRSEMGRGSTFTAVLPCVVEPHIEQDALS